MFKVSLRSFSTFAIFGNLVSQNGVGAKRTEIWDPWTLVTQIRGTFDLVVFKVILVSFGYKNSKTAGRGVKQSEIWDSQTLVIHNMVYP